MILPRLVQRKLSAAKALIGETYMIHSDPGDQWEAKISTATSTRDDGDFIR